MKQLLSSTLAVLVMTAPLLTSAQYWQDGCYETRAMCESIEDLGDEKVLEFPNPVLLDSDSADLDDTWGAARSSGNSHEGTDIFAPRGALVVMPTDGVVDRADTSGLGGKHVFVYIAGGEKLYFAHLDDWAEDLEEGRELKKGDLIGYVGNTGASWARTHLHLGLYQAGIAENPYPRMEGVDWTLEEQMESIDRVLRNEDDEDLNERIYEEYDSLFEKAVIEEIDLPRAIERLTEDIAEQQEELEEEIAKELEEIQEESEAQAVQGSNIDAAGKFSEFDSDLSAHKGSTAEIVRLQKFLNDVERARISESGEFDEQTLDAVRDFQEKYSREILEIWGLDQATGYVGITTRLKMNFLINASERGSCPAFNQYNSRSTNTRSAEVKTTEELLAKMGFFAGTPDEVWDSKTHQALVNFQERFAATMLSPWGISHGTGYKYKTTNKFMNYLVGCDTPPVDLDGQGEFDF